VWGEAVALLTSEPRETQEDGEVEEVKEIPGGEIVRC